MKRTILTIVVPCYNEEAVLVETNKILLKLIKELIATQQIANNSRVLYVDDGSQDQTWSMIQKFSLEEECVTGLKLSRNFGHQAAILAGLDLALDKSSCIVTIDADLQDDPAVIKEFILAFNNGYEVVYGVRKKRETDTFFKKYTALLFYKLMNLLGVELVQNHADFRLLSQRACKQLVNFKETSIFVRGIVPLLGFSSTKVYYDRKKREAGESKYPLKKMISFSIEGLTSFSIAPIKFILSLGMISLVVATIITIYSLSRKIIGETVSGWTSMMISLWILGGLQLISISIIGLYIGKIFMEVKHRPRFIIEQESFSESFD
ncbi:hypothetical protein A5821_000150 [Enterococcus sp. 7F3_DIV0205]|uniref:Glycosyltransferase 2-like domain-containing protein n=1 Tax=Candidatus Enterococcus palustris TaxID=1834189 RepID=A0AAQ3Y3Q6_9ENTE|nr:glycosyltransferase family 2 protein [Enterococcus sp. 7F3_DIV0205]OTN84556.1 hypothetical protein A5821_000484 [Enterococcus sp. 7F3_DIV0205]